MIAAMDGVDGHVRETWHLRDSYLGTTPNWRVTNVDRSRSES
jgi:hypothetical protein